MIQAATIPIRDPRGAKEPKPRETSAADQRLIRKVDLLSCCELRLSSSFVSRHLDWPKPAR
jgi:hypothetical protein